MNRVHHRVVDVLIPGRRLHRGIGIAPGNQENRIALLHRITHQRVLRLQIKDVKLVDARRHDQQRTRVYRFGQRRVLDELKQFVFEHHRTCGRGDIPADFKSGFIGLRNPAFLQVRKQLCNSARQAFTMRVDDFLLRFGIGRQEVRRRQRIDHLLHRKTKLLLDLVRRLDRIDHGSQKACIELVGRRMKGKKRIRLPCRRRHAAVGDGGNLGVYCGLPQARELVGVVLLQPDDVGRIKRGAKIAELLLDRLHVKLADSRRLPLRPCLPRLLPRLGIR